MKNQLAIEKPMGDSFYQDNYICIQKVTLRRKNSRMIIKVMKDFHHPEKGLWIRIKTKTLADFYKRQFVEKDLSLTFEMFTLMFEGIRDIVGDGTYQTDKDMHPIVKDNVIKYINHYKDLPINRRPKILSKKYIQSESGIEVTNMYPKRIKVLKYQGRKVYAAWEFPYNKERFGAWNAAVSYCKIHNASVGETSIQSPVGIKHGDHFIPKFRHLDQDDIDNLDGVIVGDRQYGPLQVIIFNEPQTLPPPPKEKKKKRK